VDSIYFISHIVQRGNDLTGIKLLKTIPFLGCVQFKFLKKFVLKSNISCFRFVVWEIKGGCPPVTEQSARIFSPLIKPPPFPTRVICIEFNSSNVAYYTELDAVELVG